MVKSKIVQIVYQTIYCSLAMVGCLASIGFFNAKFDYSFYIYFANISNYFCAVIMLLELLQTINKIGLMGVCRWMLILLFSFLFLGFMLYFMDKKLKQ